MNRRLYWFLIVLALGIVRAEAAERPLRAARARRNVEAQLDQARAELERLLPARASGFAALNLDQLAKAARAVEEAANAEGEAVAEKATEAELPPQMARLLTLNQVVDRQIDALIAIRTDFIGLQPASQQRKALRNHVQAINQLIDLSGRLRYLTVDLVNAAASSVAGAPRAREVLVDLLTRFRSSVGAEIMSVLLFEPPKGSLAAEHPPDAALRAKLLRLIEVSGQNELLEPLARFVSQPAVAPALAIQAAETIRRLGLPQDPRPGQDTSLPAAPITARQLHAALTGLKANMTSDLTRRRDALLAWLDARMKEGITDDRCQLGHCEVQPGDWLLMRNPSPYNLFTDLSPGIFTHVGVVAVEQGSDGIRRMVIVDLPERGVMPATNVETFLKRTRHYVFLRHQDPAMARKMGAVAASTIGNETRFDLTFSTDRVQAQPNESLAGKTMYTYCAGFLLTCALQAGCERAPLFPFTEVPTPGNTSRNLAELGMSIGNNFITPTVALYSKQLKVVGRREPMYDPQREVEEAIYDHFARGCVYKKLVGSQGLYQELQLKMAEASKQNPLLAQALTKAVGVSAETDLVAAAKAVAVVGKLDDIAYGTSAEFLQAIDAVDSGPLDQLVKEGYMPEQIELVKKYRQRHAQLTALADQEKISPRALRVALVKYYTQLGQQAIDQRFFPSQKPTATKNP